MLLPSAAFGDTGNSGRNAGEIRHRVTQHRIERGALLALERLLELCKPGPHLVERRAHRPRRDHTAHADIRIGLFAGEQNLVEPLTGPHAGERNLDVAAWLEPG